MERGIKYMERYEAIGLIETFDLVSVLKATDAMYKVVDVGLIGYKSVASGYMSVLMREDVGTRKITAETGVKTVKAVGARVYNSVATPGPHPHLGKVIAHYSLENLLPGKGCAP